LKAREAPTIKRGALEARVRESTCKPLSTLLSLAGWMARRAARCAGGPTMFSAAQCKELLEAAKNRSKEEKLHIWPMRRAKANAFNAHLYTYHNRLRCDLDTQNHNLAWCWGQKTPRPTSIPPQHHLRGLVLLGQKTIMREAWHDCRYVTPKTSRPEIRATISARSPWGALDWPVLRLLPRPPPPPCSRHCLACRATMSWSEERPRAQPLPERRQWLVLAGARRAAE